MLRVCINCTYPMASNSNSDFCSRQCSNEYDTMEHIAKPLEREKIMAVKTETVVHMSDDLTGEEFTPDAGETVAFAFDGTRYEIDLNTKNATAFRKAFEKYVKAARVKATPGRKAGSANSANSGNGNAAIRAWAQGAGHSLGDRGRIPQNIVDAYWHAHPATTS